MDRRAWGILAVALLAGIAGCSAVIDGSSERGTYEVPARTSQADVGTGSEAVGRQESGDEAGVKGPDDGATVGDPGGEATVTAQPGLASPIRAPSVTRAIGTGHPEALAEGHAAFLANRSFVVAVERRIRYANGTNDVVEATAWFGPDRRQYRLVRIDRPPGTDDTFVFEVWADRSGVYRSVMADGDPSTWRSPRPLTTVERDDATADRRGGACLPSWIPDPTYRSVIQAAVTGTTVEGIGTVGQGANPPLGLFQATANGSRPVAVGDTLAREAVVKLVVDARGMVQHLRIDYETSVRGTVADVTLTLSFEEDRSQVGLGPADDGQAVGAAAPVGSESGAGGDSPDHCGKDR